jgi:hypothetical protein
VHTNFKILIYLSCLFGGSFNTDKTERISKVYESLKTALDEGEKFVIIKNIKTGYFIQFAIFHNVNNIIMDIPLIEISNEQKNRLKKMLKTDVSVDQESGEPISIQKIFVDYELKKASEIAEKIFTIIFNLHKKYELIAEIFS